MNIPGGLFGKSRGATRESILAAETVTGFKFPGSYLEYISQSNGQLFEKQAVKAMSLEESLEYFGIIQNFGLTQTWGYFPVLENDDSNPWCICCQEPLEGYIVQVMHDDAAQVKFRNISTFFAAIRTGDGDDSCFLDDLEGDFQGQARTDQDVRTAQELLKIAPTLREGDRQDACRFAVWLLGEEQVDQIALLLEDEDFFIARDAADRLAAMQSPKAKEVIRAGQKKFMEFVERCQTLLKGAGIQGSVENESTIRLNSGNVLLDMKTFYAVKKTPNAEKEFLERAKSFIADKLKDN